MLRACLMARVSRRWCLVQTPVRRRGTILPRSATKPCNRRTSRYGIGVDLLGAELAYLLAAEKFAAATGAALSAGTGSTRARGRAAALIGWCAAFGRPCLCFFSHDFLFCFLLFRRWPEILLRGTKIPRDRESAPDTGYRFPLPMPYSLRLMRWPGPFPPVPPQPVEQAAAGPGPAVPRSACGARRGWP